MMSGMGKNHLKSSWTPLSNEQANHKMYEERRALVGKWFDKWNDSQRKQVLEELLSKCRVKQLVFAGEVLSKKKPVFNEDFTRLLPRVISLYIFSFLDPRSLCRASQVCWHWKSVTEVDQLWMVKCVRVGWLLPFIPGPYEIGTWKRFYIENVTQLKTFRPKDMPLEFDRMSIQDGMGSARSTYRTPRPRSSRSARPPSGNKGGPPPWRGSDPVPKDTWRNNYLDNDDEVEKINKLRKKGAYGIDSESVTKNAKTKLNTGSAKRSSSLSRSKSATGLDRFNPQHRPDWAQPDAPDGSTNNGNMSATISRPSPIKTGPLPNKMANKVAVTETRTDRDPPSSDLFPDRPWRVPADDYDSDT